MAQLKQEFKAGANKPRIPAMLKQRLTLRAMDLGSLGQGGMTGDDAVKVLDDYERKCKADIKKYGPEYDAYADVYIDEIMREIEDRGNRMLEQQQAQGGLDPSALESLMSRIEGVEQSCEDLTKRIDSLQEKLNI